MRIFMTIISSSSASRTVMALAMLLAGSVMPVSATVRAPDGAFHVGGLHGNGVIQVEVNGKAINGVSSPMITEMKIGGGLVVVPRENVGAGFQFASRGDGGNKYNPTLGGDCVGRAPDIGLNYIQDWRPLDFLPAENGLLLGVQPYLYQGDQIAMAGVDPGCSGSVEKHAELAPCFFHWGVLSGLAHEPPAQAATLGSGHVRRVCAVVAGWGHGMDHVGGCRCDGSPDAAWQHGLLGGTFLRAVSVCCRGMFCGGGCHERRRVVWLGARVNAGWAVELWRLFAAQRWAGAVGLVVARSWWLAQGDGFGSPDHGGCLVLAPCSGGAGPNLGTTYLTLSSPRLCLLPPVGCGSEHFARCMQFIGQCEGGVARFAGD